MKILLRLSSLKTYIMAFLNCTSDGSEPSHFSRDWAQNFEKGQSSTQAQDQFFEKGLENWDFYVVKKRPIKSRDRTFVKILGSSLAQD